MTQKQAIQLFEDRKVRPADYPVDSVTESRAFQAMDGAGGKRPPRPNARP